MIAEFDSIAGTGGVTGGPAPGSLCGPPEYQMLKSPCLRALGQASCAGPEAIAHIWRVWGKAVALLRLEPPTAASTPVEIYSKHNRCITANGNRTGIGNRTV